MLGIVKDATGDFVIAFVFLVAFAWFCAGLALGMPAKPVTAREVEPAG